MKHLSKSTKRTINSLLKDGRTPREVADKLGISTASVYRHGTWKYGKPTPFEEDKYVTQTEEPKESIEYSPYDKMEIAKREFEAAVQGVILYEVECQVSEIKRENQQLKETMETAKHDNWVTNLKKYYQITPPEVS